MLSHRLTASSALLVLLSAPGLQAQGTTDPRSASDSRPSTDPRDTQDPRESKDPRDVKEPREVKDRFDQLEGPALYDALYTEGETGRLKTAMHDNAWEILPYIDKNCEGWLALIEKGAASNEEGKQAMAEMQEKGRKLADFADAAIGDTRFTNYVNNFYGWTPEQQKTFREGQSLFHDADKIASTSNTPEEAKRALTPAQQSLDRARALGDTWGQAMALSVIGQVQAGNMMEAEARATMKEAERVGREIRDLGTVWAALSVTYESCIRTNDYDAALEVLQNQYLLTKDVNDDETADKVMRQLVELNRQLGKPELTAPPGK